MKPRLAARLLRRRLAQSPAVALLGHRQCGKTTLARSIAKRYYDAEQPHVFRSSDGQEIDLVLKIGPASVAIEIKLSAEVSTQDMARLDRAADLVGAEHRYLVCRTSALLANATRGALTLAATITRLARLADSAGHAGLRGP